MILVDTGPLVGLFDPRDGAHVSCARILAGIREELVTTVPVLTEAFHLLDPGSRGAAALREFVQASGVRLWFMTDASLARAFELMHRYADHPMDLADASLVVAAEAARATKVFTLDKRDFATYRARIGRSWRRLSLLG
jgi:predicted nucleic acid-binding protein